MHSGCHTALSDILNRIVGVEIITRYFPSDVRFLTVTDGGDGQMVILQNLVNLQVYNEDMMSQLAQILFLTLAGVTLSPSANVWCASELMK